MLTAGRDRAASQVVHDHPADLGDVQPDREDVPHEGPAATVEDQVQGMPHRGQQENDRGDAVDVAPQLEAALPSEEQSGQPALAETKR